MMTKEGELVHSNGPDVGPRVVHPVSQGNDNAASNIKYADTLTGGGEGVIQSEGCISNYDSIFRTKY